MPVHCNVKQLFNGYFLINCLILAESLDSYWCVCWKASSKKQSNIVWNVKLNLISLTAYCSVLSVEKTLRTEQTVSCWHLGLSFYGKHIAMCLSFYATMFEWRSSTMILPSKVCLIAILPFTGIDEIIITVLSKTRGRTHQNIPVLKHCLLFAKEVFAKYWDLTNVTKGIKQYWERL